MPSFTLPPADESLSLLQVFEFRAKTNPDHPLFRYAEDGHITWSQAVKIFATTAQLIRRRLGEGTTVDCTPPPVVGILAAAGSILYASLIFGTLRAGCTVFPLSTRNSAIAVAHLIAESGVKYLLVSQDAHMQDIAHKADTVLHSKNVHIKIIPIPTYEEISTEVHADLEALPPLQAIDDERILLIAHSSGSTSFPKVVPHTQKFFLRIGGMALIDLSTRVQSTQGAAMFHAMGFISIIRAAYCGMIVSLFPPTTDAVIVTPERLLASAVATRSTVIVCPPMFLEHWAQDPTSIEKLRNFSYVIFGGGPLAQSVGDALDRNGVTVMPSYGTTEVGSMAQLNPEAHRDGWQYFKFAPKTDPVLVPVDGDSTGLLFQLIIRQCATHYLALPNTEVDGVPAFDTKDLVQRHPKNPALYRVYGRVDDQIMHSNGEKTNPGPIELILAEDPHVKAAIMFGRERPYAGVIIAPSEEVRDVELFREAIWPTVERANAYAPSHSRIFKEMIVLATPSRPFQETAKGTPRRQAILEDYAQDIDAAYAAFDNSVTSAVPQAGGELSMQDALEIVRGHVRVNVKPSISDHENLFDAGADSLLAARIRSGVMHALGGRLPLAVVNALPNDVVFTSPTVAQLASFVYGVAVCAAAFPRTGDPETPYKNVPVSILDSKDDTIVRLREPAAGEPPLILVHGGGGYIYSFLYMQTHFRTGLWAIQVTSETPCTSFAAQTDFYFRKIKEAQPTGPYRVGGYSAGAFMACRIAKLLEANGDEVIQLVLIDNSPFMGLIPRTGGNEYAPETDFADEATLRAHHERGVRGVCALMRGYEDPWWPKFADCAWERWNGRMAAEDMSELMASMYENLIEGMVRTTEFVLSFAGERRVYAEVVRGMTAWMREVRAPATLYKASRGVFAGVAPEAQKEWWALGMDKCCPDLRVVEVEGDHQEILSRDELVEDLQKGAT